MHRKQIILDIHLCTDKLISTYLFWKSLETVVIIDHSLEIFEKYGRDKN